MSGRGFALWGRGGSWAIRVGVILGIPIRVHLTFPLLLLWFGAVSAAEGVGFFSGVLFVLLLFFCVVLHELGHAMAGIPFGVKTREIVLYPIGGVARLDGIPRGLGELVIALSGPAVNLVAAALLFLVLVLTGAPLSADPETLMGGAGLVLKLFLANLILFAFNLVPAFPMDGGRVLRALLTLALAEDRATEIATRVGQGFAIVFGILALLVDNFVLLFVAFFVFLGAGQERAFQRTRLVVRDRKAEEAMITRLEVLKPHYTLAQATELLLTSHQRDFPVLDGWGRVAGLLSRQALLEGLLQQGPSGVVLQAMLRRFPVVPPSLDLESVLRILGQDPGSPVLVLENDELKGMITLGSIGQLIEVYRRIDLRADHDREGRSRNHD